VPLIAVGCAEPVLSSFRVGVPVLAAFASEVFLSCDVVCRVVRVVVLHAVRVEITTKECTDTYADSDLTPSGFSSVNWTSYIAKINMCSMF
jgi:hypothetical protein